MTAHLEGQHRRQGMGLGIVFCADKPEAGAHAASVTVNGLGERAGNAPLEEVVMALRLGCGLDCSVDSREFYDLSW